jgi:hypothetical protein
MWDMGTLKRLARRAMSFLQRARRHDGRVRHACDAEGRWSVGEHDGMVQARVARALSALLTCDLPGDLRAAAGTWWDQFHVPPSAMHDTRAMAHWLWAICDLPEERRASRLDQAVALAHRLAEEGYAVARSGDWEWYEETWRPGAAVIPAAMWRASVTFHNDEMAAIADATTRFVIEHLFEDGLFLPVGTRGGWGRHREKAIFDQRAEETGSVVELLSTAEQADGMPIFGQYADYALRWFHGNNLRGVRFADPRTGGCLSAMTADGGEVHPTGGATLAWLLAEAAGQARPVVIEEPTVFAMSTWN